MRRAASFLTVFLVLTLVLSGCSTTTTPPDQIVTKFFDAMKTLDTEEMAKYVLDAGDLDFDSAVQPDDLNGAETMKAVFGRMTYKVEKGTITGDTAAVPVSVTCVDMANVIGEVMSEAIGLAFASAFGGTADDIDTVIEEMFINALKDPNAPMTTNNVTIPLKKSDGKWMISFDEESSIDFVNAITGGLGDLAKAFGEIGE